MSRRAVLITVGVVAVMALALTAAIVLPDHARDAAAREAARDYAELIASGTAEDQERLLALTATDDPGALRTAGELLVVAEQRITVVSVDDPVEVPTSPAPLSTSFEEHVRVVVQYRLDGVERRWPIVLSRLPDTSGRDAADWRVTTPLTGSISWKPGRTGVRDDHYLGATRIVRRGDAGGIGSEENQALYPAVYSVQARLDPYFASPSVDVAVLAGPPTAQPKLPTEPAEDVTKEVRRLVLAEIARCDSQEAYLCPAEELGVEAGADTYSAHWWRGLAEEPTVSVHGTRVRLTGGKARIGTPAGVRVVPFDGSGHYDINVASTDDTTLGPRLYGLTLRRPR